MREEGRIPGHVRVLGSLPNVGTWLRTGRAQEQVMVKEGQSREETCYTESVGHLGRQAQHQGMGLSVFIRVGHFIG